jgi:hypothetical protein
VGVNALGHALEVGEVGVVGGGFAADREAIVEAASIPVQPEIPVELLDEEVELLGL